MRCAGQIEDSCTALRAAPSDSEKAIYFAPPERVVGFWLGCLPVRPLSMFSRLFTLALLVLVDLSVDG
jgi:hypothetical protein